MNFPFQNLSPQEFETLSADVVGSIHNVNFERFGEGADGGIDGRVCCADKQQWILQAKRYSNSTSLIAQLEKEKIKMDKICCDRYFLVTASSLTPKQKDKMLLEMSHYILSTGDIYGADDLTALMNKYPEILRKQYKLWLGSAKELNFIKNNEYYNRSSSLANRLFSDLKYFVSYNNLENITNVLEDSHYIILVGDPGSGKSLTAGHLAIQYLSNQTNYEFHGIVDRKLNEVISLIQKGTKQVFVLDDFLGATFLHTENILAVVDDLIVLIDIAKKSNGDLKLIFTSRDYIISQMLNQIDDKINLQSLLSNNTMTINNYDPIFRANLIYSYFVNTSLTTKQEDDFLQNKTYYNLMEHKNFNPRLLKQLFQDLKHIKTDDISKQCISQMDKPSNIWEKAFSRLSEEAQVVLYILSLVETDVLIENVQTEYQNLYYKIYGKPSLVYQMDEILDELEPSFISLQNKVDDIWIAISNGGIRDFLHEMISSNAVLINIIIESFQYFEFGIEVFKLTDEDNQPITLTKNQQKIVIKKLMNLIDKSIYSLSRSLTLDHNFKEKYMKRMSEVGANISILWQRISKDNCSLEYIATELECKIQKDKTLGIDIIKTGHLHTLLDIFNHTSKELQSIVYLQVTQNIINSEDALAISIEYSKNKIFKQIIDKEYHKTVKLLENTCIDEINRATDEYHIEAIVKDIYGIENIFKEFEVPTYLYNDKLTNMFDGEHHSEIDYWEAPTLDSSYDDFLSQVKLKSIDIDKVFNCE